ncbi:MAG: ROK family protein, partial [Clostridia bacterium]|nr:ROK family protein [Clostridia bacterium]
MYYIGVDLGGTNIAIGIVNEQYEIVKKGSTPTKPDRGADAIIEDMAALAKKLIADMGITLDDIAWAGVATPGTANSATGIVEYANNIPFLNYPLADKLSALLDGKTVYIENDANAAAKAEAIA